MKISKFELQHLSAGIDDVIAHQADADEFVTCYGMPFAVSEQRGKLIALLQRACVAYAVDVETQLVVITVRMPPAEREHLIAFRTVVMPLPDERQRAGQLKFEVDVVVGSGDHIYRVAHQSFVIS